MATAAPSRPHQVLLRWYDAKRRRLPWRERPTPYRVWISEIMLQQTQVSTVLPYYERFLKKFPAIAALASAPEKDVLRLWAGLGYYSRARNLREAARRIVREHRGEFPDAWESVIDLPGVGRYTAGAVLSIAFNRPYPVLDGNVARVLSRLYALRGNVKSAPIQKKLWRLAEDLLDPNRPGDWNQAFMELGALVCLPQAPLCGRCPLSEKCAARLKGLELQLPETGPKRKPVQLRWTFLWIKKDGKVLLWKRDDSERFLPGHWGLPELRHMKIRPGPIIARLRHTITHHRIRAEVRTTHLLAGNMPPQARWVSRSDIKNYLVSSLWLKVLKSASGYPR
ncbi:MAG: A/G-specific adenine glycosylase [Elusimicrobia bacterium]|nr:A/G-specific adenine glycosylase [Elusimicrobiota bacterium]